MEKSDNAEGCSPKNATAVLNVVIESLKLKGVNFLLSLSEAKCPLFIKILREIDFKKVIFFEAQEYSFKNRSTIMLLQSALVAEFSFKIELFISEW